MHLDSTPLPFLFWDKRLPWAESSSNANYLNHVQKLTSRAAVFSWFTVIGWDDRAAAQRTTILRLGSIQRRRFELSLGAAVHVQPHWFNRHWGLRFKTFSYTNEQSACLDRHPNCCWTLLETSHPTLTYHALKFGHLIQFILNKQPNEKQLELKSKPSLLPAGTGSFQLITALHGVRLNLFWLNFANED